MDSWQLIPLLSLAAYFIYLTYYYAAPMFGLKVLLFYAHIRYRGAEIRFRDERITMNYAVGGQERMIVRRLETDPTSRFFAMTVCSEFRGMLREARTAVMSPPAEQSFEQTDERSSDRAG